MAGDALLDDEIPDSVAAELDSQLRDADGPQWIESLEAALKLKPAWMFDAHGSIFAGEEAVEQQLQRKLDFLIAIRDRVNQHATHGQTIQQLRMFHVLNGQSIRSFAAHFIRKA